MAGMWVAVGLAPDGSAAVCGPYYTAGKAHTVAHDLEQRGYIAAWAVKAFPSASDWPVVTPEQEQEVPGA